MTSIYRCKCGSWTQNYNGCCKCYTDSIMDGLMDFEGLKIDEDLKKILSVHKKTAIRVTNTQYVANPDNNTSGEDIIDAIFKDFFEV